MNRMKGKVKWFNRKKSYGFIAGSDNKDYFVHYSSIVMEGYKYLDENDEVEFTVTNSAKGVQATEVNVIKKARSKKSGNRS